MAAAIFVTTLACGGAISKDSALERNWGRSYETQRYLQAADPAAGQTVQPAPTMDGAASDRVMEGYREAFSPESGAQTVNIIKLR
jgi:hypothetical protein